MRYHAIAGPFPYFCYHAFSIYIVLKIQRIEIWRIRGSDTLSHRPSRREIGDRPCEAFCRHLRIRAVTNWTEVNLGALRLSITSPLIDCLAEEVKNVHPLAQYLTEGKYRLKIESQHSYSHSTATFYSPSSMTSNTMSPEQYLRYFIVARTLCAARLLVGVLSD